MPAINPATMQTIEQKRTTKAADLKALMATPFDVNNPKQMAKLRGYIDAFEVSFHLQLLLKSWDVFFITFASSLGVSKLLSFVNLSLPDFINSKLAYVLILGTLGWAQSKAMEREFLLQKKNTLQLYNWALKGGKTRFDFSKNNDSILKNPDIQRMIRTLAPVCPEEDLLAWQKVTDGELIRPGVFESTMMAMRGATSWLTKGSPQKQSAEDKTMEAKLDKLKAEVELGVHAVDTFSGLKKALHYFATDSVFHRCIAARTKELAIDLVGEKTTKIAAKMARNVNPMTFFSTTQSPKPEPSERPRLASD